MIREIPLFAPEIIPSEVVAAAERIGDEGKYTRGHVVPEFEEVLSATTGVEHTVATSNGTTALHLGVRAMGWRRGDKIVTSPLSFIATSNVLIQEGHPLVFGPVNDQLQLEMPKVYDLLADDPSIRGIVVPYIYGHGADGESMAAIRRDFPEVRVVEDAAQALAEKGRGLGIGEYSDAVAYSFHENKVITTLGEGGALQLHDSAKAHAARSAREQGRLNSPDWLNHIELGFNYRMTEIQAAAGLSQVERLGAILDRRQSIVEYYIEAIKDRGLPFELPRRSPRSWFGFYAIANTSAVAEMVQHGLAGLGIGSRRVPMPAIYNFAHIRASQPTIRDGGTAEVAERVLNLPLYSGLSDLDVERVVDGLELTTRRYAMNALPMSSDKFYTTLADSYAETRKERQVYLDAVDDIILKELGEMDGQRIIDIGCGDGVRGVKIATALDKDIVSLDASDGMVMRARQVSPAAFVEDIGSDEFDTEKYASNAALLLWNVLGHINKNQRGVALRNIAELLEDDGILILDVNNQFNAAQYGEANAARNRDAVLTGRPEHTGDFTATHSVNGQKIKTVSHIFHTDEISNLLHDAGFESTIRYVHYDTGEPATEDTGQIVIVARKKRQ